MPCLPIRVARAQVCEYCSGGDLMSFLLRPEHRPHLSYARRLAFSTQVTPRACARTARTGRTLGRASRRAHRVRARARARRRRAQRVRIARTPQAASAIEYMHAFEPPFIHCDVKSPNYRA